MLIIASTQPTSDIWLGLLGIAVGVLGTVVGIYAALLQLRSSRRGKRISYEILSDTPILGSGKGVQNNVDILINTRSVNDARYIIVRVVNSGNRAVKPEDYVKPIMFNFAGEVISSNVVETKPKELLKYFETMELNPKSVTLPRFLLNPDESVTISTLLVGTNSNIEVTGRIYDGEIVEGK